MESGPGKEPKLELSDLPPFPRMLTAAALAYHAKKQQDARAKQAPLLEHKAAEMSDIKSSKSSGLIARVARMFRSHDTAKKASWLERINTDPLHYELRSVNVRCVRISKSKDRVSLDVEFTGHYQRNHDDGSISIASAQLDGDEVFVQKMNSSIGREDILRYIGDYVRNTSTIMTSEGIASEEDFQLAKYFGRAMLSPNAQRSLICELVRTDVMPSDVIFGKGIMLHLELPKQAPAVPAITKE